MSVNRLMRDQLRRLERCFALLDLPMCRQAAALEADIDELERVTGIEVSGALREMWQYSNGSQYQTWFIPDPEQDRELIKEILPDGLCEEGFCLLTVEDSLKWWTLFKDVDESSPGDWTYDAAANPYRPKLDPRIATQLVRHRLRLPFGGQGGGSDELQIDAGPSPVGQYGQVVEYVHDPDNLLYVACSFESFFDRSLWCMEEWIRRDPEHTRELFDE
jgi:cell wall assembly regulator SMI1